MKSAHPKRFPPGFSFIELLITLAVFSILTAAVFAFFTSQRDSYVAEDLKLERDQNLRMAMETIVRELSQAGYRAADVSFIDNLPKWAPSAFIPSEPLPVTLDANPKITLGEGNLPDVISFAGSISTANNPTTLSEESDGTSITVSLSNSNSEKQYKPGDVISVGYLSEFARVAAVDGSTLTIDTDPKASGMQPLQTVYPAGTPLEEISVVSYAVFNDENDPACKRHETGRPLLKRKVNAGGFYPVAENIAKMKVTQPEDGVIEVSLTGSPSRINSKIAGSGEKILTARVSLRNGLDAGFASGCVKPESPGGLTLDDGLDDSFPCEILISWDPVTNDASGSSLEETGCPVTGYRIYFDSVSETFGNSVDVSTEDASGYVLDVSGIPSAVFYISVAAENSGGLGEKTPEAKINDTAPPEKVSAVSAEADDIDKIALSWDENTECDLAGYYLYRKKVGEAFILVSSLIPAGSSGYTDTGLDAGQYIYKLEAVDFGFNAGETSDAVVVSLP